MSAKSFLQKLLRMRAATIKKGVCGKPVVAEQTTIREVRTWMEFWNPTDEQVRNYIRKNMEKIELLLPGGNSPMAKSWRQKYQSLMQ